MIQGEQKRDIQTPSGPNQDLLYRKSSYIQGKTKCSVKLMMTAFLRSQRWSILAVYRTVLRDRALVITNWWNQTHIISESVHSPEQACKKSHGQRCISGMEKICRWALNDKVKISGQERQHSGGAGDMFTSSGLQDSVTSSGEVSDEPISVSLIHQPC